MAEDAAGEPLRVLHVEDSDTDALVVRAFLTRASRPYHLERVATLSAASAAVLRAPPPDAVLLDLGLPDAPSGVDAIQQILRAAPSVPIVVVTDSKDDEILAIRAGAQDHVRKSELHGEGLDRAIRLAVERERLRRDLLVANARLAELHHFRHQLLNNIVHDMGAPITVVQTQLDILSRAATLREPERRSLRMI